MRWRKVAIVVKREYLARVRTRAFWISTLAVPALLAIVMTVPSFLLQRTGGDYRIAVVARAGPVYTALQHALDELSATERHTSGALAIRLERLEPANEPVVQRDEVKRRLLERDLEAVLVLPDDLLDGGKAQYLSRNVAAFRLMSRINQSVAMAVLHVRLTSAGIPPGDIAELTRRVDLEMVRVAEGGREDVDAAERSFVLTYVLTFLLFMTLVFYGYYVMRGVLEEKSSRIVEVIVSNIRPIELMLGKIFGVGSVGLTQYAIWVVVAMNVGVAGLLGASMAVTSQVVISPRIMVFFVLFFVLGYFQFASFYAAVGAAFNTEEEAQQMQSVAGMLMAMPLVLMIPVMANPDSTVSIALSLIPLFSPVLFFMRMTVEFPPTWQVVLCLTLLVANIFLVARVAAAVYRVGILMYGKRPTLREVWAWVRSS